MVKTINGMEPARYIAANLLSDSELYGDKYYAEEDQLTEKIQVWLENLGLNNISEDDCVRQLEQELNKQKNTD